MAIKNIDELKPEEYLEKNKPHKKTPILETSVKDSIREVMPGAAFLPTKHKDSVLVKWGLCWFIWKIDDLNGAGSRVSDLVFKKMIKVTTRLTDDELAAQSAYVEAAMLFTNMMNDGGSS